MRRSGELAAFHDLAPAQESFRDAVLAGLSRHRKALPCRFLYDERGSELFEEICELPEYYLTRTEISILADRAPEIAESVGRYAQLIEFGSGSSRKVRLLLGELKDPAAYVAIDISRESLRRASEDLALEFPHVPVVAICADYLQPLRLPPMPSRNDGRRLGFFPGSTIGNFTRDDAVDFLYGCRNVLGSGGMMLVGVDLKKDAERLNAAYNDAAGVTAAFNLNLLERVNRELDGDFNLDRFEHDAFYNQAAGRIEIYIRSLADQVVTVLGRTFGFEEGERIHTEDSCKYTVHEFQALATQAGFRPLRSWTDSDSLFAIHLLGGRL